MLYIYRRKNSLGARDLTEGITLAGTLARRTKGPALRNLQNGDAVICWGDNFAAPQGIRTLNNVAPISKFTEAQKLAAEGIPTVQVSQQQPRVAAARPAGRPAYQVANLGFRGAAEITEAQARAAIQQLNAYLAQPLPPAVPAEIWLPRRNNHVGGNDLLSEQLAQIDYYSKKENIVEEYRLHMFRGKSIRAGKKVARATRPDGRTPAHAWIRSFDAGWVIQYDGFTSTKDMRTLAAKAVKALGLDFAAVDLGKKADGTLIVLEVNRAPGVEGGSITAYARHIVNWLNGQEPRDE